MRSLRAAWQKDAPRQICQPGPKTIFKKVSLGDSLPLEKKMR
jgi:hypothetical protein